MRVRYISGNTAGQIVEMGPEAAILLSNHIVERVPDVDVIATDGVEPAAVEPAAVAPEPEPSPAPAPEAADNKTPTRAPRKPTTKQVARRKR